jgi:hypothetical protein
MPDGDIETFHRDGHWFNRVEGGDELPDSFESKGQAAQVGRREAIERAVTHVIRDLDGRISERNSEGRDPASIDDETLEGR